jgi:hypothetical protein
MIPMTEVQNDTVDIELTENDLEKNFGVVLRKLSGHVCVIPDLPSGLPWYLRVADSPELEVLDLRNCSGGIDLELDVSTAPRRVLMPDDGGCVLLTVAEGLPAIHFEGPVLECLVCCLPGHSAAGHYLIDECLQGLALLPTEDLAPVSGIARYLRVDQTDRGLQYKDLRARTRPEEIYWRLVETDDPLKLPVARILAIGPERFSEMVFDRSTKGREHRRAMFDDFFLCGAEECRHLVRMERRGFDQSALWAWRCMLQRRFVGDRRCEHRGRALVGADPRWIDGRKAVRSEPTMDAGDLRLFIVCHSTGWARRFEERLLEMQDPTSLDLLIEVAASVSAAHPLSALLEHSIRAGFRTWDAVMQQDRDEMSRERRRVRYQLERNSEDLLGRMAWSAAEMMDREIGEEILEFIELRLSAPECIRLGIEMCDSGFLNGRQLIVRGIGDIDLNDHELRARAMNCLLASSSVATGAECREEE